ncbi:11361_t:CDS:2, partial [Acaulospora colombiana]
GLAQEHSTPHGLSCCIPQTIKILNYNLQNFPEVNLYRETSNTRNIPFNDNMASLSSRAGNFLSIDGGVNPLSALYIIDEMLQRLKFDLGSEGDIRACDWFDLIIGSGHGGYVSVIPARLFPSLMLARGPVETKGEKEMNLRQLMDVFEAILADNGHSVDSSMRFGTGGNRPCKVSVAACATVASPDAYDPVVIGGGDDEMYYIDATTGLYSFTFLYRIYRIVHPLVDDSFLQ